MRRNKTKQTMVMGLLALFSGMNLGKADSPKKDDKPKFSMIEKHKLSQLTGKAKKAYVKELKEKYRT